MFPGLGTKNTVFVCIIRRPQPCAWYRSNVSETDTASSHHSAAPVKDDATDGCMQVALPARPHIIRKKYGMLGFLGVGIYGILGFLGFL